MLASVAALGPLLNASPASAAPTSLPAAFDLARYRAVDPASFRSLAYADNGRSFFTTGRWNCQIGPTFRSVGCQGRPATAPPGTQGAAITADAQGPWWVPSPGLLTGTTYRFGSTTGFRAPRLGVGTRVTIAGVTCTVPSAAEVACRTGNRALIFAPGFHKFYFPAGDTAHNENPAPRYLPAAMRSSNQLPAVPAPPA
ncbi:hypothetical protein [Gordonia aichiensis]